MPLPTPPNLAGYLEQTRNLLNDRSAAFYSDADLTTWINTARVQAAADGECLRVPGRISTVVNQRAYQWSTASFDSVPANPAGVSGILAVRDVARQVGSGPGQARLSGEPWEWFNAYYVQQAAPVSGMPTRWASLQPGAAGAFWIDPIPDAVYVLILDAVCYPGALPDVTEILPFPWTDAVPYYAAYLAYEKAQRTSDAHDMFQQYRLFARRATQMTTPTELPRHFPGGQGAQTAQQKSLVGGPADAPAQQQR